MRRFSQAMVCGLGASGAAAARLLRAEGAAVLAVDERAAPENRMAAAALEAFGCAVALGAKAPPAGDFDAAVALLVHLVAVTARQCLIFHLLDAGHALAVGVDTTQ